TCAGEGARWTVAARRAVRHPRACRPAEDPGTGRVRRCGSCRPRHAVRLDGPGPRRPRLPDPADPSAGRARKLMLHAESEACPRADFLHVDLLEQDALKTGALK